jgi:hypothetical protein
MQNIVPSITVFAFDQLQQAIVIGSGFSPSGDIGVYLDGQITQPDQQKPQADRNGRFYCLVGLPTSGKHIVWVYDLMSQCFSNAEFTDGTPIG